MHRIAPVKRAAWIAGAAFVLGTLVPVTASARCVRDVAESGAVGVRCSDGVRGRLPSDDVARPAPSISTRSGGSALGTRGNNSALSGSGAPQSALSSGAASKGQRGPYGGGRPGDNSGGMYSLSRGNDSGTSGDRRPY
jgi:hypothetical protein